MDLTRMKERKRQLGYTNEDVARLSGVPLGTVQKVLGNTTKNPRRDTLLALARVLDPEQAEEPGAVSYSAGRVRESSAPYGSARQKKQGEYTVEDYLALPDEQRVELIDGVIYDMTAPGVRHQIIAGEVYAQLLRCVEEHGVPCMPGIAPIDVQLDRDNRTMVQPDVIIAFDPDLNIGKRLYGAPEFVLEILSPSTRSKDQILKLHKYKEAGCLEYWIVDPENERVMVYFFRDANWPDVYTFCDQVPVAVSDGLCAIDFPAIREKLKRLSPTEDPEELVRRREAYAQWMEEHGRLSSR